RKAPRRRAGLVPSARGGRAGLWAVDRPCGDSGAAPGAPAGTQRRASGGTRLRRDAPPDGGRPRLGGRQPPRIGDPLGSLALELRSKPDEGGEEARALVA